MRKIIGMSTAAVLAGWTISFAAEAQHACHVEAPCEVEDGSYLAVPPATWDGTSPLPVLVFFHGYAASAAAMLNHQALIDGAARLGALLVLPDGRENSRGQQSWSHQGSPSQNRDELAYIDSVVSDVQTRYPTDGEPPLFAGFSQGGSMVWNIACSRGQDYGRYVSIGGGFWEPMPAVCAGPVDLVHVHGLDDTVVPLEGRPIGDRWQQGNIFVGFERFKAAGSCSSQPTELFEQGDLHCRAWTECSAGQLTLCLHDGGHSMRLDVLQPHLGPS